MPKPKPGPISQVTLSRRDLLAWLGDGCVLALGGAALAACGEGTAGPLGPAAASGADAGVPGRMAEADAGGTVDSQPDVPSEPESPESPFDFSPGPGSQGIHEGWPDRTVDRQQVASILDTWELRVDGLVESPTTLSFYDVVGLERTDFIADFHCVEGWSIYDVPWNGLRIGHLLDRVGPLPGATHVTFHTLGGRYNESLPIDVAREEKSLLAYGIGGSTLPLVRGFPLRLVIPRLLAYKSAKYVERVELTSEALHGYWVAAGYPYDGEVAAARLRPGKY